MPGLAIDDAQELGPCICGQPLTLGRAPSPTTGEVSWVLVHPMPMCKAYKKDQPLEDFLLEVRMSRGVVA